MNIVVSHIILSFNVCAYYLKGNQIKLLFFVYEKFMLILATDDKRI